MPSIYSLQGDQDVQELLEVAGNTETGDGIPALLGRPTALATAGEAAALAGTRGGILEDSDDLGVIELVVDESQARLALAETGVVDKSDQTSKERSRGGSAADALGEAINNTLEAGGDGGDVRNTTAVLVVVTVEVAVQSSDVLGNDVLLPVRAREVAREAARGEANTGSGLLGVGSATDGSNPRASSRERRHGGFGVLAVLASAVAVLATGRAAITRRVDDSSTTLGKETVQVANLLGVVNGDSRLVVAV